MNDIRIFKETRVGEGFIPSQFLRPDENEYWIRDEQLRGLGKDPSSFRPLSAHELEVMVRNSNSCNDWSLFLVKDPFFPELLRNNLFFGLIRISCLEPVTLEHHDISMEAGIYNSQIIACDIGDNCVISNCSYLSHYIIDNHCILINNAEIQVSNHSKFGNGIIMEGEDESVRITLDVMNENGGRWIYPFDGMLSGDAWLWAKFRDRKLLMERFEKLTNEKFDLRLGRYGMIGRDSVLKHNRIIKDTYIGESAYIKGSNKLKNLTINSNEEAPTQIGEGVELVNGILGHGCHVFYGCKAVRFVMCDNSSLKYGARLIHSVLGENSTVSCCEILNNLIFPSHEQHHNTSFLIASLIKGQSNLAAGATVGSNHNSRAADGEIEAGRGFWPGLCTSVKHSSRFASFCLLAKSDYKHELNIRFPFCLVDSNETEGKLVLGPGWWWYSNTYALMRNEKKFKERDKRLDQSIRFIYSPFAPDSMSEIFEGLTILEEATGKAAIAFLLKEDNNQDFFGKHAEALLHEACAADEKNTENGKPSEKNLESTRRLGVCVLSGTHTALPFEVYVSDFENSNRPQKVIKPCKAWNSYREMLLWFAIKTLLPILEGLASREENAEAIFERGQALYQSNNTPTMELQWENLGGFLVRHSRLEQLLEHIEEGSIQSWDELHCAYRELSSVYEKDVCTFAWEVLEYLSLNPEDATLFNANHTASLLPKLTKNALISHLIQAQIIASEVARRVYETRAKDWSNPFRKATFRNEAEQIAVYGRIEDNSAIQAVRSEIASTQQTIGQLLSRLTK